MAPVVQAAPKIASPTGFDQKEFSFIIRFLTLGIKSHLSTISGWSAQLLGGRCQCLGLRLVACRIPVIEYRLRRSAELRHHLWPAAFLGLQNVRVDQPGR